MRAVAGLVLVAASATWSPAQPHGRVVRVERSRTLPDANPILCEIREDLSGMCLGAMPRVGDTVLLVDAERTIAEIKLTSARPRSPTCNVMWEVRGDVLRGDLGRRGHRAIGLIDPGADPQRTRQIERETDIAPPDHDPDTHVLLGVDRDGDRAADLVVTATHCATPAGNGGPMECLEIWSGRAGRKLLRTWSGHFRDCM